MYTTLRGIHWDNFSVRKKKTKKANKCTDDLINVIESRNTQFYNDIGKETVFNSGLVMSDRYRIHLYVLICIRPDTYT